MLVIFIAAGVGGAAFITGLVLLILWCCGVPLCPQPAVIPAAVVPEKVKTTLTKAGDQLIDYLFAPNDPFFTTVALPIKKSR
jgi:hypothetical protein